jgi:TPR repeat protein
MSAGQAAYNRGDYAVALKEWLPQAQAGDAAAALNVGALYDMGHGVPQDFAQALTWYRRAAAAGSATAMFNVGVMYDSGRGVAVDRSEAARWYEKAARRGDGRAAYDLALMYENGDGVRRDPAHAERLLQQASAHGIAAARHKLAALTKVPATAHATLQQVPVPVSPQRPEVPPNQAALGKPSEPLPRPHEPGPPGESQEAITKSEPAVPPEKPEEFSAQSFLMVQNSILTHRDEGADPAAAKLLAEFVPAMQVEARNGNALAAYDLGYCYQHGIGVAIDKIRAYVNYVRAAALADDPKLKAASRSGAEALAADMSDAEHQAALKLLEDSSS